MNWILQANPEGERNVGEIKSEASTYMIELPFNSVAPVGELKMQPGNTTTSFLIILNWHGSKW